MDYPALARQLPLNNHVYRLTYDDGSWEDVALYVFLDYGGTIPTPAYSTWNEETEQYESRTHNHYVIPYWKLIRIVDVELQ